MVPLVRDPVRSGIDAAAAASDEARSIRDEVGFFQAIRVALIKSVPGDGRRSPAERELAIQQIVSRAAVPTAIVDISRPSRTAPIFLQILE